MLTLTASGSVSEYTDSASRACRKRLQHAGVDKSLVTIEVVASVIITATIGVPASTTAAAVEASLSSKLAPPPPLRSSESVESNPSSPPPRTAEEDSSSPVAIIRAFLSPSWLFAFSALAASCVSDRNKPKHVTLNNPNAGGAAPGGKPTKGYQMAVKEQKDLAPNQA